MREELGVDVSGRPLGGGLWRRPAVLFDALFEEKRRHAFEQVVVAVAVAGFLAHLALIALATVLENPPVLIAKVGTNFLSAIYTPFSFVLFYEVLLLVLAVPESTTRSIRTQFEIVSLIIIRRVFKDIAQFESLTLDPAGFAAAKAVLTDTIVGLMMFGLVAVFYRLERSLKKRDVTWGASGESVAEFIGKKKAIALFLSGVLASLAAINLVLWVEEIYRVSFRGAEAVINVDVIFYKDLFMVMVFTDVLILLLSLSISSAYHLVFRNAGFIVATIVIRLSLVLERPYDVLAGLFGMLFGVLVLLLYNYYVRVEQTGAVQTKLKQSQG